MIGIGLVWLGFGLFLFKKWRGVRKRRERGEGSSLLEFVKEVWD